MQSQLLQQLSVPNSKVIYTKVEQVGMHFSCLHAFIQWCQARAGWIFHPSMSLGSFGSYKQAAPCMQARKTHAHSVYLDIDDFDLIPFNQGTLFASKHGAL